MLNLTYFVISFLVQNDYLDITPPSCVWDQRQLVVYRDEAFGKRLLTNAECRDVMRLSNFLLEKTNDATERTSAATQLGEIYGHRTCLPALFAVVRDETEDPRIRGYAAGAMSIVPDRRVIDEMIGLLLDEDPNISFNSLCTLMSLTEIYMRYPAEFSNDPAAGDRQKLHRAWSNWWKKNRDTAKLEWSNAFATGSYTTRSYNPDAFLNDDADEDETAGPAPREP